MAVSTQYRTTGDAMNNYSAVLSKLAELFLDAASFSLGTDNQQQPIVITNGSFVNGKIYVTFSDNLPNDPGAAYYDLESLGQVPL